jgi:siroheme synthase (precorrin-2 oxidase/ferrochelatase)
VSFGYPVMLELGGRRCVVIGAQAIREGKVEGLLAAGADDVLVVDPDVGDRFDGVGGVAVERRAWRPADLDGAFLVIASAGDARRGVLVLAIGTGGASPAAARLIRERLDAEFGEEWTEILRIVGEVRRETLAALPDFAERASRWHEALDLDEAADLVRAGRGDQLAARLRDRLLREARAS